MTIDYLESPLGTLAVVSGDDGRLLSIDYVADPVPSAQSTVEHPAVAQLREYFAGSRRQFSVPYTFSGSEFQRAVWQQIALIPFGETRTYGELARAIGRPSAGRAVGAACGQNPLSIIVPCHRVMGVGNRLTGYAGGVDKKAWLLAFEGERLV